MSFSKNSSCLMFHLQIDSRESFEELLSGKTSYSSRLGIDRQSQQLSDRSVGISVLSGAGQLDLTVTTVFAKELKYSATK